MNKLKKYMYQSGGITIVEDGEYIRDNNGKVGKITNIPTHDDNELIINNQVQKVSKGKGGQGIYNVESVLSATHENRNQSDNTYTQADEEIKIKPQEALALAEQLNLQIKRPLSSLSPSKLMDKLLESREKIVSKYKDIDKEIKSERQANSFTSNVAVLNSIPTPEDIYEFLFTNQENSKSEQNEMYAKTGIPIDPEKKGTFKSATSRYGMSMDALAMDAKQNPEKYSGILRKKANFYRNFAMQTGGRLQTFPTMDGSKPVALVNTPQGIKKVSMIDNRTVSMDDMYNKDSVQIQGNKAVIVKKNPLKKFIK